MNITKCIAVDDEPLALEQMIDYISKVPYLELIGSFENGLNAFHFLKENHVDLIFLDIEMDELNGVQLASLLKDNIKIIFTTAYEKYALKAFDLDITDYLLKPISFDRFLKACEKTKSIQDNIIEKNVILNGKVDFFFVKTEYKLQKVMIDEILFIEGMKEYLIIKTNEERFITLSKFENIQEYLPKDRFIRVHKSYIVCIEKIDAIERSQIIIGDKRIPIGRTYKELFEKSIEQHKLK